MADNQGKRREAIESLLAERKKFDAWLSQLEAKRASTAEHIFARVHADYMHRLEAIRERLGAEADGIRSLVGEIEARLSVERSAVTEKTDERAEMELRAAVGELSEKGWNATRAKCDATIAELRSTFDATARELVEMTATLSGVMNSPRSPSQATPSQATPSKQSPPPPTGEVVAAVVAAPAPAPAPAPEPAPEPEAAPSLERASPSSKPAVDGAPTPRTSQAIRSLKCQECGTLNFPTEWYCEQCGGELAAF